MGANVLTKLAQALSSLVKTIVDAVVESNSPENKMAKARLAEMQDAQQKREYVKKLDGMAGYVNSKTLEKSGDALTNRSTVMKESEFWEFSALCKRNGIVMSGVQDIRAKELTGDISYHLMFRASDAEQVKYAMDLYNAERRIADIDKDLYAYTEKGMDNLSNNERVSYENLLTEKEDIKRGFRYELNDKQAEAVLGRAAGIEMEAEQGLTFSQALNRNTGRQLNKDVTIIVADTVDPTKHIKCHGEMAEYDGKEYIKTNYEVCHGDKVLLNTHDGRFDGRPPDYWETTKIQMQDVGGFEGQLLRFKSQEAYDQYLVAVSERNENTLGFVNLGAENRDYGELANRFKQQLEEDGAYYDNGVVFDSDTRKPVEVNISDGATESNLRNAELLAKGNQIKNYENLDSLKTDYLIARATLLRTTENTPERAAAQKEYDVSSNAYQDGLKKEATIHNGMAELNSVNEEMKLRDSDESIVRDMAKQDMAHDIDGQNEQGADLDSEDNTLDMEGYKEIIGAEKAQDAIKAPDITDKDVIKEVTPKDRS